MLNRTFWVGLLVALAVLVLAIGVALAIFAFGMARGEAWAIVAILCFVAVIGLLVTLAFVS